MSDAPQPAPEPTYPLDFEQGPKITPFRIGEQMYSAEVGMLPLKDEFGNVEAGMSYFAYRKVGVEVGERPLMFSFNGGPGSSSVWLHLGAVGPKRVALQPDGAMPAPPYRLEENPHTWLLDTDLVFIDPVGTGYSRPAKKDGGKKYWSLEGDIESVGEFIRLYLTRTNTWSNPLYLVGESYGTTRAAGLSNHLLERGIALNGIVLVSAVLNFQTGRFHKGNDLPYQVFLPTYAATAWYHKKLKGRRSLASVLAEAEKFASGEYLAALAKGDQLSKAERTRVVAKIADLTGLSPAYVEGSDLRINIHRFCKELLRDQKRTVGRLDSRYKGIDEIAVTENPQHDPSMTAILAPYTATLNDYVRRTLGWETDTPYYIFNPGELWKNWTYGDASNGHPDTSEALRAAMSKNPFMKVFIASGYYDLATPYYATRHTVAHMGLDPELRKNISFAHYEAGHMMYVHEECLRQLREDVGKFLGDRA